MKRPTELFTEADRQAVASSIAEAETKTSGEIVPVVAVASGRYDRGEDIFGLVLALLVLIIIWCAFQDVRIAQGAWKSGYMMTIGLIPTVLIVILGFGVGAFVATRLPVLKLPFVTKREMRQEVERAAAAAFRSFRVSRTAGGTGILIYVSLFERMVRVEGGGAIIEKLGQEDWDKVCKLVTDGLTAGRPTEGLCNAIKAGGELLAKHFPIAPDDENELANELHLVDETP